jgi:hypothetical protein
MVGMIFGTCFPERIQTEEVDSNITPGSKFPFDVRQWGVINVEGVEVPFVTIVEAAMFEAGFYRIIDYQVLVNSMSPM